MPLINTGFKLINDIELKLFIKKLKMKKINSTCNSKYYICKNKLKKRMKISFQWTIKELQMWIKVESRK